MSSNAVLCCSGGDEDEEEDDDDDDDNEPGQQNVSFWMLFPCGALFCRVLLFSFFCLPACIARQWPCDASIDFEF